ncbi:uncharacterized protein [Dysidea avara]
MDVKLLLQWRITLRLLIFVIFIVLVCLLYPRGRPAIVIVNIAYGGPGVTSDGRKFQKSNITTGLIFPYSSLTFPPNIMLRSQWAVDFKAKLDAAKLDKQVVFLMIKYDNFPSLINWLGHTRHHATSMLENLIIVSLDDKSHYTLLRKGIFSALVQVREVVKSLPSSEDDYSHAEMITRFTLLRILNYWGYDVIQMDSDVIFRKDIQPILDHFNDTADTTDLVTSTLKDNCAPTNVYKTWKFCISLGFLLIRDTFYTETLWQRIGHSPTDGDSSQVVFNNILLNHEVTWTSVTFETNQYLNGTSSDNSISVLALPRSVVCSDYCNNDQLSSSYVYHASQHVKKLWLVRDHWNKTTKTIQSTMTWLNEVTLNAN